MKIDKSYNQYYSNYIEKGISSYSMNKTIKNKEPYNFTDDEMSEMNQDIINIYNFLGNRKYEYIGNHTSLMNGDLKYDNINIELKYVNNNSGTYYNTSTEYVNTIGYISYSTFLKNKGYYQYLIDNGISANLNCISPVNQVTSKNIRNNKILYDKVKEKEKILRTEYVMKLFNYLDNNPDIKSKFSYDMITKQNSGKDAPDILVIYDYNTKTISSFNKMYIKNLIKGEEFKIIGNYSIKIGKIVCTFAWQNGTGLNNPTIRVFLEV